MSDNAELAGTSVHGPEPASVRLDLNRMIEQFRPGESASKRRAEILIKQPDLRVVLITMLKGAHLQEHTAPGPVLIQCLQGELRVTGGETPEDIKPGVVVYFQPGIQHAVEALTDSAFLLTIGWETSMRKADPRSREIYGDAEPRP
ncbi:MAG TPA: cupin domain-containing protein [Thermomicrobiales bacterium]|nr:cupin domain-containing protein [Thermomicrobiales bacterium]